MEVALAYEHDEWDDWHRPILYYSLLYELVKHIQRDAMTLFFASTTTCTVLNLHNMTWVHDRGEQDHTECY